MCINSIPSLDGEEDLFYFGLRVLRSLLTDVLLLHAQFANLNCHELQVVDPIFRENVREYDERSWGTISRVPTESASFYFECKKWVRGFPSIVTLIVHVHQ